MGREVMRSEGEWVEGGVEREEMESGKRGNEE